jgi:LmbE family N-acetylglucosaminyl deacetylase
MNFNPTFCIDITEQIDQKMRAVAAYPSQFPDNVIPDMVKNLTAYFGGRIGTKYAEPFYSHEVMGFGGLDQLV